jgi:3-hydroxyacyl-[acyl-carrier-protein] dehydratase
MPPALLYDISGIDLNKLVYDQEAIRAMNPQRGDMEHLNGIVYADGPAGRLVGFKDVRADEFWVPGHIPGRPLLPGVIMIEAAAQLASFYMRKCQNWEGFVGFSSVESCKFRLAVSPGCRMYLVGQKIWERHRRTCSSTQGVVNGQIVFECQLVGMLM